MTDAMMLAVHLLGSLIGFSIVMVPALIFLVILWYLPVIVALYLERKKGNAS